MTKADVLESIRTTERASAPPLRARWAIVPALASAGLIGYALTLSLTDAQGRAVVSSVERAVLVSGAACVVAFIAIVIAFGALLHGLGREPRGSLGLRVALRDADRHRGRTTGLMVSTASIVALGLGFLMLVGAMMGLDLATYQRRLPSEIINVTADPSVARGSSQVAEDAVAGVLGEPAQSARYVEAMANDAPAVSEPMPGVTVLARPDVQCSMRYTEGTYGTDRCPSATDQRLVIASDDYLTVLLGKGAGPAIAELAKGRVVVFADTQLQADGTVAYVTCSNFMAGDLTPTGQLPASQVQSDIPFAPVISEAAAAKAGFTTGPQSALLRYAEVPTVQQYRDAQAAVQRLNDGHSLDWDRGPYANSAQALMWVTAIAGGALVAISLMGVALVAGENARTRTVLATLGATRRTMRSAAMLHALVAVGLGVAAGVVACVPLVVFMVARASHVVFPWLHIGLLLVVPLALVTIGAGFITRAEPRRVVTDLS